MLAPVQQVKINIYFYYTYYININNYKCIESQEQRPAATGIQLRDLQSMLSGLTGAQGTTEKPPGD